MGFFENILEGFFKVIGIIAEGIRKTFLVLADVVNWIGVNVLPVLALVFSTVVLALAALSLFAPLLAEQIVYFLLTGNGFLQSVNIGVLNTGPAALSLSLNGLRVTLATFLEIIHFDTLLALHEIAWVLSAEYRKTLSVLFKAMSGVSEAVFGWTLGMRVILENSRSIILSTSASMGYDYDVSQLIWLNKMTDIVSNFNEKAEIYMDDPEMFFFDLEEWVDQYAVDLSGGAHALIYNSVRLLTDGAISTANNMQRIDGMAHENERSVNRLTAGHYGERIDFNFQVFKDFQGDDYAPTQERQEKSINMNRQETAENRKTLSDLNWKLKRPTGQLDGIEDLPEPQKSEEEINLQELSTRPFQEESNILESEQAAADAKKEKEAAERQAEQEKPVEPDTTVTKPITKAEFKPRPPVNSWFVGDY